MLGSHPYLGVESELALQCKPEQFNLLTISFLIITMSNFNYKGSISMKMNRYKAFGSINKTGKVST